MKIQFKQSGQQALLFCIMLFSAGLAFGEGAVKAGCDEPHQHARAWDTLQASDKVQQMGLHHRVGEGRSVLKRAAKPSSTRQVKSNTKAATTFVNTQKIAKTRTVAEQAVTSLPRRERIAFLHPQADIGFFKNVSQDSLPYFFLSAVQQEAPAVYQTLRDVVAFYQRKLTNQLLTQMIAQGATGLRNPKPLLSNGPKALRLHRAHGTSVPFFTLIGLYHGQAFVHDCLIPLVARGAVSLSELHKAWDVFELLAMPSNYQGTHFTHAGVLSCVNRARKWDKLWLQEQDHHLVERYEDMQVLQAANQTSLGSVVPKKSLFDLRASRQLAIHRLQETASMTTAKLQRALEGAREATSDLPIKGAVKLPSHPVALQSSSTNAHHFHRQIRAAEGASHIDNVLPRQTVSTLDAKPFIKPTQGEVGNV